MLYILYLGILNVEMLYAVATGPFRKDILKVADLH